MVFSLKIQKQVSIDVSAKKSNNITLQHTFSQGEFWSFPVN